MLLGSKFLCMIIASIAISKNFLRTG